jgi:hypothetical protein
LTKKIGDEIVENLPLIPQQIKRYAQKLRVAPGIIVGRLQYANLAPKAFGNELKTRIELFHA